MDFLQNSIKCITFGADLVILIIFLQFVVKKLAALEYYSYICTINIYLTKKIVRC